MILSATVISSSGLVNEGTETFTILNGSTTVGTPVTYNVVSGAVSGAYNLPGGAAAGTYTIQAVYNGTSNYNSSTDSSHFLTIGMSAATTTTANVSTPYTVAGQSVNLSAAVTSTAGTVNAGTETFTILSGTTVVGTAGPVNVVAGASLRHDHRLRSPSCRPRSERTPSRRSTMARATSADRPTRATP